jgi:hypothetical protein
VIKTVPLFVGLALLGAVRDVAQTLEALRENRGVAGLGGLSTLLQPDLARFYVEFGDPPVPNGAIERFSDLQTPLVALAVLVPALILYARPDPETFSTVYVVTQCALYAGLVAAALAYGRRLLSGPSRRGPTTA